jgi:hypothetical protein
MLIFVGPLGRALRVTRSAANARAAAAIANVPGRNCAWNAATKALRHIGQRFGGKPVMALEDLAKALGRRVPALGKVKSLEQLLADLRGLGVRIRSIVKTPTMKVAERMVPHDGSVVLVNLEGVRNGVRAGGHCVYLFRDLAGRVRIADRYGVFENIEQLAKRYASKFDSFRPLKAAVVENLFGMVMRGAETVPFFMVELEAMVFDEATAEKAQQVFRQGRAGVPNGARFHRLQQGETLESVALQYYGDATKWPIVYAGNQLQIGDDPAKLRPNQTLWIPD